MCGVYYIDDGTAEEIRKVVKEVCDEIEYGRDIRPSQKATVLTGRNRGLISENMKWGFPQYQGKGLLINARAETALEKKTFRNSMIARRCVVPARHYYEWNPYKDKVTFYRKEEDTLYMAGCYNLFDEEKRFVILTTEANASVRSVHDRMPLLLERKELDDWIFDDRFTEYALKKQMPMLEQWQRYEQQMLRFE